MPKPVFSYSNPDPYFKLFVNDDLVYNGEDNYKSDIVTTSWSFRTNKLNKKDIIRIEWWDKDDWSDDDKIGVSEFAFSKGSGKFNKNSQNSLKCQNIVHASDAL